MLRHLQRDSPKTRLMKVSGCNTASPRVTLVPADEGCWEGGPGYVGDAGLSTTGRQWQLAMEVGRVVVGSILSQRQLPLRNMASTSEAWSFACHRKLFFLGISLAE